MATVMRTVTIAMASHRWWRRTMLAPDGGAYLAECDYFLPAWQRAFWGEHQARLQAIKQRQDLDRLFFAHHGVGSEAWSADGFAPRLA